MHCQKLTQTYSKVPPLECSLLGKRTQTLSQDLLWTITPSGNPTHTVRQHNGPSYSHSDIQLTLLNGKQCKGRRRPFDLHSATNRLSLQLSSCHILIKRFLHQDAKWGKRAFQDLTKRWWKHQLIQINWIRRDKTLQKVPAPLQFFKQDTDSPIAPCVCTKRVNNLQ